MVLGEDPLPVGSTSARSIQLCGRRGVQNVSVLSRVVPGSGNISPEREEVWGMQCESICHMTQHPIDTVGGQTQM